MQRTVYTKLWDEGKKSKRSNLRYVGRTFDWTLEVWKKQQTSMAVLGIFRATFRS
jgi:hypothetical protein